MKPHQTTPSPVSPSTASEVEATIRRIMDGWSLCEPRFEPFAIAMDNNCWTLGYSVHNELGRRGTYWDANIINGVFYLLNIRICKPLRGRGQGAELYALLERLACELACKEIRQTPSGWTPNGDTRRNYLLRRGWREDGIEVYKNLTE